MDYKIYQKVLGLHYSKQWGNNYTYLQWNLGKLKHSKQFGVFEFPPNINHNEWIYATCGMSFGIDCKQIELFIYSPKQAKEDVELLTIIADYHLTNNDKLDVGHTVNFGRTWRKGSLCEYGLISLPYTFGPDLELFNDSENIINIYWLIPITKSERDFKIKYGLEALEDIFESNQFNYINPKRGDIV